MKALSIIRVSSEDQKYGYGPDSQWEDDILENAPGLGLEVSKEFLISIEERATDWNRLKYTAAISQAIELHAKGEIGAVIFPRVDRETRFVFSSMPLLSAMLRAGLQVYFAREKLHLDPKNPEAVEIYLNKVGQSQAYVETMRLNTMRGRKRRVIRDGLLPTGGLNLYGYYYSKDTGKRSINKFEAAVIRKIVGWVINEGIFLNEVCRRLMAKEIPAPRGGKYWSRGTIGRILNNEVLTGKTYALKMEAVEPKSQNKAGGYRKTSRRIRPKDEWVLLPDDTTPAIITQAEFEAVKRQLARNRELSPRNQKHQYLLRGFIYCQDCGRKHYGVPVHGKRYYRCSGRSSLATGSRCHSPMVNADKIEQKVWAAVSHALSNPDRLVAAYKNEDPKAYARQLERQLDNLKEELVTLDNAETRLIRLFEFTPMTETKFKAEWDRNQAGQKKVEQQINDFEQRINKHSQTVYSEARIRELADSLREILGFTSSDFAKEKRQLFEGLNMKVWISKGFSAVELGLPAVPKSACCIATTTL